MPDLEPPTPGHRVVCALLELLTFPGAGLFSLGSRGWGLAYFGAHLVGALVVIVGALGGMPAILWWGVGGIVLQRLVATVHCLLVDGEKPPGKRLLIVGAVAVAFYFVPTTLIRDYVVEAFRIPSASMEPNFGVGDHIFVDKLSEPGVGDAVTFRDERGLAYVKRIVAVGPAEVKIRGGRVSVDGVTFLQSQSNAPCPLEEPCTVYDETNGETAHRIVKLKPSLTQDESSDASMGPGEVYLLGDNRDASHDSRHMGPIARSQVEGVVTMVWWNDGG